MGQWIIIDRNIDIPKDYREGIGAWGVMRPILTLEGPKAPLSLPEQPNQSLDFADKDSRGSLIPYLNLSDNLTFIKKEKKNNQKK